MREGGREELCRILLVKRNPRLCPCCGSSVTKVVDADPEEGEWLTMRCAECGCEYEVD